MLFFQNWTDYMEMNKEMAGERRRDFDTENTTGQRLGYNEAKKMIIYSKEATVIVDLAEVRDGSVQDIIKEVNEKIGGGKILAIRPRQGKEFEITLSNEEECEKLEDGLRIKQQFCEIRKLQVREYVVSFMHLPAYVDDQDILDKLEAWGVTPSTNIKRRTYPGTEIADGTRYVKVRFPKEVVSLPYSSKFETAEGTQYFRIIHDRQVKTCRLCMDPGHVFKDCPDFICYQCKEQGHLARSCNAVKCPECRKVLVRCECWMGEGENSSEQETDMVVNVGGQKQRETEMDNVLNKEMEDCGLGEENEEEEHQADTGGEEKENDGEKTISQGTVQRTMEISKEQEEQKNNEEDYQEGRMERKGEEKHCGLREDNGEKEHQGDTGEKKKELDGEITTSQWTVQKTMDMSEEHGEQQNDEEGYQERRMERKGEEKRRKEREGIQRRRTLKVTPNIDIAKKRFLRQGILKDKEGCENRFDVLRDMEHD